MGPVFRELLRYTQTHRQKDILLHNKKERNNEKYIDIVNTYYMHLMICIKILVIYIILPHLRLLIY